jgi:hypothetical protein
MVGREQRRLGDCSRDALDSAESSIGEGKGEIVGFLRKVGDEGMQSEWVGRQCQKRLHQRGRLVGEVVPVVDSEPRGLDNGAQLVWRG